jgi:hypothetical protein
MSLILIEAPSPAYPGGMLMILYPEEVWPMGGFGSGRGERSSVTRCTTLAALERLDVRWVHRQGYLDGQEHWTIVRHGRGWLMLTSFALKVCQHSLVGGSGRRERWISCYGVRCTKPVMNSFTYMRSEADCVWQIPCE